MSQLIGATAADVRRPFLYHGLLAGRSSRGRRRSRSAWGAGRVDRALSCERSLARYAPEFKVIFPDRLEWVVCWRSTGRVLLGLAGAWVAVGRELRRFAAGRSTGTFTGPLALQMARVLNCAPN